MNETLTLYKLMILYLLKKVDFPLATTQISDFMLGMEYTNYFRLQEALSELQEANLVEAENTYRRTLYHLTGDGVRTIRLLQGNINFEIRRDIDAFVKENEFHLREALSAKTGTPPARRSTGISSQNCCRICPQGASPKPGDAPFYRPRSLFRCSLICVS